MGELTGSFQYSWIIDVQPEELQRGGIRCKCGTARIRDRVLPNPEYRPTSIFSFKSSDKDASFWHNKVFGVAKTNVLTIIGSSTKSDGTLIIFTEKVTKSLRQWCTGKQMIRKAKMNHFSLLSDNLAGAMRGILAGMYQSKKLGGHVVMGLDDIFFVDGVVKVSRLTKTCTTNPVLLFVKMIEKLFGDDVPLELLCFLKLLELYCVVDPFLGQLSKHPSLYKVEVKLDYRSAAAKKVEAMSTNQRKDVEGTFKSVRNDIMVLKRNKKLTTVDDSNDWLRRVKEIHNSGPFLEALNPPNLGVQNYGPNALSFLRYGRNIHQHPGTLSYEDIEAGLINIWPEFVPCIHEALRRHKVIVGLTDEMDNVPN